MRECSGRAEQLRLSCDQKLDWDSGQRSELSEERWCTHIDKTHIWPETRTSSIRESSSRAVLTLYLSVKWLHASIAPCPPVWAPVSVGACVRMSARDMWGKLPLEADPELVTQTCVHTSLSWSADWGQWVSVLRHINNAPYQWSKQSNEGQYDERPSWHNNNQ